MLKSQKSYFTVIPTQSVPPACAEYFKAIWLKQNQLSERQYLNRMKNATIADVLLFCHVCMVSETEILKPLKSKFKNVVPYDSNLQTTIE